MVSSLEMNVKGAKSVLFTFFTLALGRLGIKTTLFELNQETIFLALFLELAHGFLKAVFICNLDLNHLKSPTFFFDFNKNNPSMGWV